MASSLPRHLRGPNPKGSQAKGEETPAAGRGNDPEDGPEEGALFLCQRPGQNRSASGGKRWLLRPMEKVERRTSWPGWRRTGRSGSGETSTGSWRIRFWGEGEGVGRGELLSKFSNSGTS